MEAIALNPGLGSGGWGLGGAVSAPLAIEMADQRTKTAAVAFESHLKPLLPSSQPPAPSPSVAPSPQPLATGPSFAREAFNDFVGQTFFGELLKQMRATVDKPAYFHGGMGEEIFQAQMDQILVERMSDVTGPTFSEPMYELLMARK